jgi:hypothetical protein
MKNRKLLVVVESPATRKAMQYANHPPPNGFVQVPLEKMWHFGAMLAC